MSGPTVGAVVRCGDQVGGVYATVTSLLTGSLPAAPIALVADWSTPAAAVPWLAAFAQLRGLRFLQADGAGPGSAWNAGLRALGEGGGPEPSGPPECALCVEAGDTLEPSALEAMARRLAGTPDLVLATTGVEWIGPGLRRRFTAPPSCTAEDILADFETAHVSSLFRWRDWAATPGFDESLPALEHVDFWLTLLAHGTGAVEPAPLLRRRVHARALYRRAWGTGGYRDAVARVLDRHQAAAAASPERLLAAREGAAHAGFLRHQEEGRRLREIGEEIARLRGEREALLAGVPADWEPSAGPDAFARTSPLSHDWGYERGTPADRPLIEQFLAANADAIRGAVLEVQEDDYTRRFGGPRVSHVDVLDIDAGNPRATIVGDLRALAHVPASSYDCIILTQTLHVLDDMRAALAECRRLLKDGGVLLATMPAASRVCLEYGPEGDYWRVTEAGARRVCMDVFPPAAVETCSLGNAVVNAAFMMGLGAGELPQAAYAPHDPYFPALVGVRAAKTPAGAPQVAAAPRGLILMYHRVGARPVDPHRLSVSEATFRAQLDWLRHTCEIVPLEELAACRPARRFGTAVAITFDDGYVDNLRVAAPLLVAAGAPATFFCTSAGLLGTAADDRAPLYVYWWDRLADALLGALAVPVSLTVDLPGGARSLPTATPAERAAAHTVIYRELVSLAPAERDAVVEAVARWARLSGPDAADRRMTAAEMRELADRPGMSIGAHTVNHLCLPAQPGEVIARELAENRAVLARIAGRAVSAVAYPFGACDEPTIAAARAAGFELGVSCAPGRVRPTHDPLALPRLEVVEEPIDRFIAKVEG